MAESENIAGPSEGSETVEEQVPEPGLTDYEKSLHPTWGGINFRTAENLCFATAEQLLQDYKKCRIGYPVSGGVIRAWMNWTYSGEATSDKTPEGEGTGTMSGGLKYSGKFKKGLMHGQGKLEFGTGLSYEGQFFYNCLHGKGTYRWKNGASYEGEVLDALPNGTGNMHTGESGFYTYHGTWVNGLRHGQGSLTYGKEGEAVYHGGWENDRKHGEGKMIYTSGSTYRGGWSEGKRNGRGRAVVVTLSLPEEPDATLLHKHWRLDATAVQIYEGEWSQDVPHGSGTDIWADDGVEENKNVLRNKFSGNFLDGKRNGQGSFYYASGAIFKGEWKDNMKEGPGYLVYEDNTLHAGVFTRDRFLPTKDESLSVREPLDVLLEGDPQVKRKVAELFQRCNTKLREIFTTYSYFPEKPTNETNARYLGRPRALLLEQFWQLCHDIQIVEPGLGLAQLDALLRGSSESWDSLSDVHSPTRQFIYREFAEILIKLARCKNVNDQPLAEKVDELLQERFLNFETCGKESTYTLVASHPIQKVFEEFKPQLQQMFNETLREIGTSDGTVKIAYLNMFFQRFAPELVADQTKIIAKLISALYYVTLNEGEGEEENAAYMEYDINFREFQLCLHVISQEDTTMPESEPQEKLRKVLQQTVVSNVGTNLEVLVNEPPPPVTGKKGGKPPPKKK